MTSHAGLAMAMAMPGKPAPLPTSMTRILAFAAETSGPSARSMAGRSARESATCLVSTSSIVAAPVRFMTLFFSSSVAAKVRTWFICASSRYDARMASVSTSAAAAVRTRRCCRRMPRL